MRRSFLALAFVAVISAPSSAQHGGAIALLSTTPPREASQFDFLVGEWALTSVQRYAGLAGMIHGGPKMTGTWKAHRAFDGYGIEDELRLAVESGNPVLFAAATRAFDADARHWIVSTLDVYRTRMSPSVAEWKDGKMVVTTAGDAAPAQKGAAMTRLRFFDITPSGFTAWQDRSSDGGKTWDEGRLRIQAKRTRPAPR